MGPGKIEGATARQRLRPLPLGRKVFEALRLNLCESLDLAIFPGKRNLEVSLCKAVHGCAKTPFEKPSFMAGAGAPGEGRLVKIRAVKGQHDGGSRDQSRGKKAPRKRQGSTLGLGSFWESREKRLTPIFDARPDCLQIPLEATTEQNRARLIEIGVRNVQSRRDLDGGEFLPIQPGRQEGQRSGTRPPISRNHSQPPLRTS